MLTSVRLNKRLTESIILLISRLTRWAGKYNGISFPSLLNHFASWNNDRYRNRRRASSSLFQYSILNDKGDTVGCSYNEDAELSVAFRG